MTIDHEIATEPPTRRSRMIAEFQEARQRRQEKMRIAALEPARETAPPETPPPPLPRRAAAVLDRESR